MTQDIYNAQHILLVVIHLCQWVEYDTGHIQGKSNMSLGVGRDIMKV